MVHGPHGTLILVDLPDAREVSHPAGVVITKSAVRFLGPAPPVSGLALHRGLTGSTARIADLFSEASRLFLERVEEADLALADLQRRGRESPLQEIWGLARRTAAIRAHIDRAIVAFEECGGASAPAFPGLEDAADSVRAELERVQELAATVRQGQSDLILLRNAEEANRIGDAANELSRLSNRIAALANISNIRMLGLTYVALVLGLVSAVVLIPNTAATILGMPSAGWVPGVWVDVLIVALAVVPITIVFSRPWVRALLKGLSSYEGRTTEGLEDLPEVSPESAAHP